MSPGIGALDGSETAGVVGAAALALAVGIVVLPATGLVPSWLVAAVAAYWWLAGVALALAVALALRAVLGTGEDERYGGTVEVGPSVSVPDHGLDGRPTHTAATPGQRVDDLIASVRSRENGPVATASDRGRVRARVRDVARSVLVERGHDPVTADRMLDRGTWTDSPRAAAFLGGESVERPLRIRVADWASGRGFERTVAASVDAVAALIELDDDRELPGIEAVDRWLGVDQQPVDGRPRPTPPATDARDRPAPPDATPGNDSPTPPGDRSPAESDGPAATGPQREVDPQ